MQNTPARFPEAPAQIGALKLDPRGYPIPWFVGVNPKTGEEDFRVIGPGKITTALKKELCWICGRKMGRMKTFVIGPMCAVNRVSSEPPSHLDCARFAATHCPFLTHPMAKRDDKDLPDESYQVGTPILRNPGVALVWGCLRFKPWFPPGGGMLFEIGPPVRVEWYAHARPATREEVLHSLETGMPILQAEADKEGFYAQKELRERHQRALQLLPKAA